MVAFSPPDDGCLSVVSDVVRSGRVPQDRLTAVEEFEFPSPMVSASSCAAVDPKGTYKKRSAETEITL